MSSVLLAREGGIATITLDRPDQGNAIDMDLARAQLFAQPMKTYFPLVLLKQLRLGKSGQLPIAALLATSPMKWFPKA